MRIYAVYSALAAAGLARAALPQAEAPQRAVAHTHTHTATQTWEYEELPDPNALCLDGSRYGLITCIGPGPIINFTISIQGGGWCYDESDCAGRAGTPLGSSRTWPQVRGVGATGETGDGRVGGVGGKARCPWLTEAAWGVRTRPCVMCACLGARKHARLCARERARRWLPTCHATLHLVWRPC